MRGRGTGGGRAKAPIALILLLALAGCSSSSEGARERSSGDSSYANVDIGNTRNALSSIDGATVSDLAQVWSLPLEAKGEGEDFFGSPVVVDEIAYLQDPDSNVLAIDVRDGSIVWKKNFEMPTDGPNGVIAAQGAIFGATPSEAFALDADTGRRLWSVRLVRNESETIAMAPGYHDGRVYVSTSPEDEQGNEVGVLWALDAESGAKVWHFDTVPRGLWGNPEINFGGGTSHPPAFDGEGSMYIGTGNPGPIPGTQEFPWGSSRPGPNLYTSSIVKLDERTGEMDWHYQVTPHGLCNWDVGAPVLSEFRGRKLVIAAGLGGIVVALDRETGELLWRQPVGRHNGHDKDGLLAMNKDFATLKTPMTVYPGVFGGAGGPMSARGSTVFVPVMDSATRLNSQTSAQGVGPTTAHLMALSIDSGEVKWKRLLSSISFGPTLATNDLVFATSYDGWMRAFDAGDGRPLWKVKLSPYTEGGITVTGDTLLVRSGYAGAEEEAARLVAYRLRR